MPSLPNSAVTWRLLPAAPSQRFSAIYYRDAGDTDADRKMASVDAGDPGLYVGGGTLNQQFGKETPQADRYTQLHRDALADARAAGAGKIALTTGFSGSAPAPVVAILSALSEGDTGTGSPGDGTTFLDIFAADARPYGIVQNYALAYVVPPNGSNFDSDAQFLNAVETTAARIVALIARYHDALSSELTELNLDPITVLRMALFSGGQFNRPKLHAKDVAKANYAGLCSALAAGSGGLEVVEFENGTGEFAALLQSARTI